MTVATLLRSAVAALDAAGVPFMLTGSLAAAYHGAGRATMDIDLVIDPTAPQLRALVRALTGTGTYLSSEAAEEALVHRTMFNVIDTTSGWKIDLIVRRDRAFSTTEFGRRRPAVYEGCALWVASVEDLIVAKLEWAERGGSARQLEDVAALVRIQAEALDREYLERWVVELGLAPQWRQVSQGDRA
ncbi:MAG: nucleotidyl transferase AbiEii/AbiGii toxin family protein [Gemmatimonadota bacterium]